MVGNHQEAIVLTNQKQGAPIATALQGLRFRDATLCVDFAENATTEAMEKTSARNTNVLTITWFSPSSTMIAVYYNMETAQEKARVLDRKMLEGRRLKVEMNRAPAGVALRYYQPESVKIMNLPVGISTDRVQHFAGAYMVKQLKPAQYNLDDLLATLRRILAQADGLENFEHNHAEDGKITGKARFRFSDQAQTARDALDGKRLQHNFPVFKAFLPKALQYIISISPQQYNAQKRSWDSLRSNNKAAQVTLYENPHTKKVSIRVVGEDKKAVGALRVRVETLVAGEKLDATFWHHSFMFAKGKEFLDRVYAENGMFLRCDWKIRLLRMYGDDERKQRAKQMIKDEVARLANLEWTIPLKRQSIGYLVRKGMAALKAQLGEDAVSLDLSKRPARLTLRGGEEARHALNVVLEQALSDMDLAGVAAKTGGEAGGDV